MITLRGKDANRFIEKMIETENRKPTKTEYELAREIRKNAKYYEVDC